MEAGTKQQAVVAPVVSSGPGVGQQQPLSQAQLQQLEDGAETGPIDDGIILARVHVPELCVSKCLQFPKDQLVWDVKQQCLASLPKELKESFNYGLFYPPVNGKAGKFLDEERRLGDYPFNGRVGYLELKYKRRVYKMLHLDEKQLKAMHTRTNLRRLLDYVANSQVEKIAKMCGKGLDPNFHCQDTGETPLTLATTLKKPSKVIIALVNGGALLDYRTKEGLTAMHRAVERNNLEAVKTLLELGASPNYKDTKGLTPLYYSVIYKTDPMLCETLLHDHATIGAQDLQGWQEVHQACRNNLVQHLDHLLFYGADMNARNASGNTPLHVCAVNNTDSSCIRQLLFRGAQKDALNYANQTPYQVAVIAGNMELADVIKNYQPDEVVPFKGPPRYNPKRRSVAFGGLSTSCSAGNLGTLTRLPSIDYHQPLTPSSPVGMSTSLISSSGSSSSGSASNTLTREHTFAGAGNPSRVVSSADAYLASGSLGRGQSTSATTTPTATEHQHQHHHATMPRAESHHGCLNRVPSIEQKQHQGNSSTGAVTTSAGNTNTIHRIPSEHQQHQRVNSDYQSPAQLRELVARLPSGEHYQNVRIEGLTRLQEHRIELQHRLDIHAAGGPGGVAGLRPLEMPPSPSPSSRSLAPFSSASSSLSEGSNQPSGEDSASIVTDKSLGDTASDVISDSSGVGTSQSDTTNNSLSIPGTTVVCVENYNSGIPGHLAINQGDILEVTGATDCGLLEGVLRGQGTGLFPAHCVQEVRLRHSVTGVPIGSQQMVAREAASVAVASRQQQQQQHRVLGRRESAQHNFQLFDSRITSEPRTVVLHRSRKGFGFVLRGAKSTTNLSEMTLSARYPALQYLDDVDEGGVADLAGLRKGDFLIRINDEDVTTALHEHVVDLIRKSGELVRMTVVSPMISLPNSQSAAALPTSQPIQRQYATLPRKTNNSVVIGGTLGRSPAPMPPRRDPKTTLSVGRARARSMVAGLGGGEKEERDEMAPAGCAKSNSSESLHLNQGQGSSGPSSGQNTNQPRTASIRSRPTSSRITAAELEELFQRQQALDGCSMSMSAVSPAKGHYGSTMQMSSSSYYPSGTINTKSHPTSPAKTGRVYASVAEMKRKGKSSRVRFFGGLGGGSDLHRDFHSTPDLNVQAAQAGQGQGSALAPKGHRSQEDVNALQGRNGLPPPNHPPPPPPVGQVVKVNVGAPVPDVVTPASVYDNMAHIQQVKELAAATAECNYGVMSSFRPSNNAKLYASPEDMKSVGYRSLSLPSHTTRAQLRKSHSLRTPNGASSAGVNAASFKSSAAQLANGGTNAGAAVNGAATGPSGSNQYAQPLKNGRSHSTAGIIRERKKKSSMTTSSSASNLSSAVGNNPSTGGNAPPIPEPDYSLSESENDEDLTDECDESEIAKELEKAAQREKLEAARETSGNSNASAGSGSSSSSSGSGSLPHSFSVEEIQNVRKQLKTQQSLVEDGDNSSSGVSSDQDVPVGPPTGFDDTQARNNEANLHQQHVHHQGHADKESNNVVHTTGGCPQKRPGYGGSGLLTRHAVSLAQLPPPLEADAEEQGNDLFVPPPPEFNADGTPANATAADELVFAPPPQFCDNGKPQPQQQKVKIIGAIPKAANNNNQVKPPSGRLHSQ